MDDINAKIHIKKRHCINVMLGFLAVIFVFTIASVLTPDKKQSDEENRVLQEFPKLSLNGIKSTDYMKELEAYTADQFVERNLWIKLKTRLEILFGKQELNNVYVADDDYLIQKPAVPNNKSLNKNINAINKFKSKHKDLKTVFLLAPNAGWVMKDYLPSGAPIRNQEKDYKDITTKLDKSILNVNAYDTLKKHENEGIYYKTDHHWTTTGAMYAFLELSKAFELDTRKSKLKKYIVAKDFYGTLSSNSGYYGEDDVIEVYNKKGDKTEYVVTNSDDSKMKPTVYDIKKLKEKDKYQVFMGGNHGMVDIMTTNKSERRLLVFKDSYANSFVPFLIPYFNEIIMIDPRYYYDNIDNLISSKGITDTLFLYNLDTFVEDNSLYVVLE